MGAIGVKIVVGPGSWLAVGGSRASGDGLWLGLEALFGGGRHIFRKLKKSPPVTLGSARSAASILGTWEAAAATSS